MEGDNEHESPVQQNCGHTHASVPPELGVTVTSNGHSPGANSGEIKDAERRVHPLKIRLGPKTVEDNVFRMKKCEISKLGQNIENKHAIQVDKMCKQQMADWKTVKPIVPNMGDGRPGIANHILKPAFSRLKSAGFKRCVQTVKKGVEMKQYAQSLGIQPRVKFKCRKCSSMSFKSLAMLKEHQRLCKAQTLNRDEEATSVSSNSVPGRVTKKVYLCSSCSTYYENWNLFLHMREVHNRHICLYCLGMFSRAEKLSIHLFTKHSVVEQTFRDVEEVMLCYDGPLYLMCCSCDKLYTEKDKFSLHKCTIPVQAMTKRKICKMPTIQSTKTDNSEGNTKLITSERSTSGQEIESVQEEKPPLKLSPSPCADNLQATRSDDSINIVDSVTKPETMNISKSSSEPASSSVTQSDEIHKQEGTVSPALTNLSNQGNCSITSDNFDFTSTVCDDSPKNENNNITTDKEREGGIKLKLLIKSLNNSSPVIIDSTVRPNDLKPQVRPTRPPGGHIVAPGESVPPAFVNKLSTIYDNKSEDVNTMNRVPKLTVRVPKGLLDKDSSSDDSSDSANSDKLTVDDTPMEETLVENSPPKAGSETQLPTNLDRGQGTLIAETASGVESVAAEEDVAMTELSLDRPLDKYPLKELLKVCLGGTMYYCVYCNHARKIAVNCKQLAEHMLSSHRFSATVDSITAEELLPETIKQRVSGGLDELNAIFINLDTYDSVDPCKLLPYVRTYECFQCYFITTVHKDLYLHNRKMHQKTILLCVMCKSNFYSYSELLCHLCPGTYDPEYEMSFRCCMCNMDNIPSAFRLMVHLRKVHHACDVCTEVCHDQSKLSTHVWKHKLHHLCYRCGIAYRNKADITKHLFWKHGTESVLCKRCLQKKWPHVYHFCIPPTTFICEECNENFTRAVNLKVHKRLHSETYSHKCLESECGDKFVSKKLLAKHILKHEEPKPEESLTKVELFQTTEGNDEQPKQTPRENEKEVRCEESSLMPKPDTESPEKSIKLKKKKNKDKDNFLLDVNLPALNLSESDSSDESGSPPPCCKKLEEELNISNSVEEINEDDKIQLSDLLPETKLEEESNNEQNDQPAVDIWDNFKQYQAKVEKLKTPPLTLIRKHVCESDHDYCLIPKEVNGDSYLNDVKRHKRRLPRKRSHKNSTGSLSSSNSSSSSGSCCSRGSKCSCSSSSGTSSSSSCDSDSSSSLRENKKRIPKNHSSKRRNSNGSHSSAVDVMAVEEQPPLVPEKKASPIPESDLETDETDTDEEFYDEHPQRLANKLHAEKRNQLMLLASVAPSDNGSLAEDFSRPVTPEKVRSPKKKSKTKKRKKSKKGKEDSIKVNIPKEVVGQSTHSLNMSLNSNKITISLNSNTLHIPTITKSTALTATKAQDKRASKRRRVPNKFYGYSDTDDECVAKPPQHIKHDWIKDELPSQSITNKQQPSISHRIQSYNEPILRMSTPVPDPVPPPILMNTESMDSSATDSSVECELKIDQTNLQQESFPVSPAYAINSGPSSLPVHFPKPAGVRQAREGESVYCYCRCPYDEVSEMIACDALGCAIEWFHFECVGIMVPPKGKWYCPDCRQRQGFI